jgi:hypothetical protein
VQVTIDHYQHDHRLGEEPLECVESARPAIEQATLDQQGVE